MWCPVYVRQETVLLVRMLCWQLRRIITLSEVRTYSMLLVLFDYRVEYTYLTLGIPVGGLKHNKWVPEMGTRKYQKWVGQSVKSLNNTNKSGQMNVRTCGKKYVYTRIHYHYILCLPFIASVTSRPTHVLHICKYSTEYHRHINVQ